jgi:hypothetical protein
MTRLRRDPAVTLCPHPNVAPRGGPALERTVGPLARGCHHTGAAVVLRRGGARVPEVPDHKGVRVTPIGASLQSLR